MTKLDQLSPNHRVVYQALKKFDKPVTAYELIAETGRQGITAPPTVYRALERLIATGRAHRLESINAFIACAHDHHQGGSALFMICRSCGDIAEMEDRTLARRLDKLAGQKAFSREHTAIEMRGLCNGCSA